MRLLFSKHSIDLSTFLLGLLALYMLARPAFRRRDPMARVQQGLAILAAVILLTGFALTPLRYSSLMSVSFVTWVRAVGIGLSAYVIAVAPCVWFLRWLERRLQRSTATVGDVDAGRRKVLSLAKAAVVTAPVAIVGFGIARRNDLHLNEVSIAIPNLPTDLQNLRIVQLSDIHMSAFLGAREVERAIAMANETKAHIALVTGDLISIRRDPLDTCILLLAGLRSDAGTFGCMGNHEEYTGAENYTERVSARYGIRFLRSAQQTLKFGASSLNLGGVDYQPFKKPYLRRTESLLVPDATNVLLSHNPDVFPVAAKQGWDLTIGGHTHGGQVDIEILSSHLNVMRFYTPYTYGSYSLDQARAFVTRGIGTIGVPVRIGAPAEIALIRLVRA